MGGFFFNLGKAVGANLRKANWVYRSVTGSEAEAIQAEVAVGRDLAQAMVAEHAPDPDQAVQGRLTDLAGRLAACLREQRYPFTVRALQAPEVNGFALPGGFVFLTRPLVELCAADADALAFVLGHEMAHVACRHAMDRLMANSVLRAGLSRLSVAGGLLGASLRGLAASLLHQGYSREQELEADGVGARLAAAAGFDPWAAVRLLERLAGVAGPVAGLSAYFSSHPPFEVRIGHLGKVLRG